MSHIPYIDSHVHLDRYSHEQCIAMLDRAARTGVHTILTVGVDVPSSTRAVALARQFGASHGVVVAVGLHLPALMFPSSGCWPKPIPILCLVEKPSQRTWLVLSRQWLH